MSSLNVSLTVYIELNNHIRGVEYQEPACSNHGCSKFEKYSHDKFCPECGTKIENVTKEKDYFHIHDIFEKAGCGDIFYQTNGMPNDNIYLYNYTLGHVGVPVLDADDSFSFDLLSEINSGMAERAIEYVKKVNLEFFEELGKVADYEVKFGIVGYYW